MCESRYTCSCCNKQINNNEPVKMYSEDNRLWFFHNNATCYSLWKLERIRAEAERIKRYLDSEYCGE